MLVLAFAEISRKLTKSHIGGREEFRFVTYLDSSSSPSPLLHNIELSPKEQTQREVPEFAVAAEPNKPAAPKLDRRLKGILRGNNQPGPNAAPMPEVPSILKKGSRIEAVWGNGMKQSESDTRLSSLAEMFTV